MRASVKGYIFAHYSQEFLSTIAKVIELIGQILGKEQCWIY